MAPVSNTDGSDYYKPIPTSPTTPEITPTPSTPNSQDAPTATSSSSTIMVEIPLPKRRRTRAPRTANILHPSINLEDYSPEEYKRILNRASAVRLRFRQQNERKMLDCELAISRTVIFNLSLMIAAAWSRIQRLKSNLSIEQEFTDEGWPLFLHLIEGLEEDEYLDEYLENAHIVNWGTNRLVIPDASRTVPAVMRSG